MYLDQCTIPVYWLRNHEIAQKTGEGISKCPGPDNKSVNYEMEQSTRLAFQLQVEWVESIGMTLQAIFLGTVHM